jgi:hypothetical protein
MKTYDVACIAEPEILCANVDRRTLPVRIVSRPRELAKLLANFHSGQSDITLLSLPDAPGSAGGPPAGSVKRLRLLSYEDPAKALAPGTHLTTQLAVHTSEEIIVSYTHRGGAPVEATVNLKDLKARAQHSREQVCNSRF